MAIEQRNYADLRLGDEVTLKLREGESVIVGTVTEETEGGGLRVGLANNSNSVVIYPTTNFRIFAEAPAVASVQTILNGLEIGAVFTYYNKHGKTVRWVKSGDNRVTRVDSERPAYSLSIDGGFTDTGDAPSRIDVEAVPHYGEYEYAPSDD